VIVKDAQALELRKAGASYDQIARQLGYTAKGAAHKAVTRALKATMASMTLNADEYRQLAADRLDAMLLGVWQAATRGDPQAISAVLRIEERRANMLGLDAPKRTEVTGQDGGPIEVDSRVTYSVEERQQRILEIIESTAAGANLVALPERSDLATPEGSTNGRVA
jgi:hypothetical protein